MQESLFLIMEEDLKDRFKFFEEKTAIKVHLLKLKTVLKKSKLKTILSRLTFRSKLKSEYQQLKAKLQGVKTLYISNPEGFIAKNILLYLRRDFPSLKIISLQHGIFALSEQPPFKRYLKTVLNIFFRPLLGYFPIGDGFGDKTTDMYIVYNKRYKDFLLSRGWKESEVIISSYFLKGTTPVGPVRSKENGIAVYFLQCLYRMGITEEKFEIEMISHISKLLAKKYEKVLIKQHPYANVNLPKLPENVEVIDKVPAIENVSIFVSGFSTALLDYEKYHIPTIAIRCDEFNVDPTIYEQFLYIHDYNLNSSHFDYKMNPKRKDLPVFFEIGITDLEQI